jgi:hypothetical protein
MTRRLRFRLLNLLSRFFVSELLYASCTRSDQDKYDDHVIRRDSIRPPRHVRSQSASGLMAEGGHMTWRKGFRATLVIAVTVATLSIAGRDGQAMHGDGGGAEGRSEHGTDSLSPFKAGTQREKQQDKRWNAVPGLWHRSVADIELERCQEQSDGNVSRTESCMAGI